MHVHDGPLQTHSREQAPQIKQNNQVTEDLNLALKTSPQITGSVSRLRTKMPLCILMKSTGFISFVELWEHQDQHIYSNRRAPLGNYEHSEVLRIHYIICLLWVLSNAIACATVIPAAKVYNTTPIVEDRSLPSTMHEQGVRKLGLESVFIDFDIPFLICPVDTNQWFYATYIPRNLCNWCSLPPSDKLYAPSPSTHVVSKQILGKAFLSKLRI